MNLIRPLALFLHVLFLGSIAHAGTGVFSSDGNRVYLANGQLGVLDLSKPDRIDKLTTPTQIGEPISAVTRAGELILCLSQHHVASYNPRTREWKKITDATGGVKFLNMSYDPSNDRLLITKYPGPYEFYDGCGINLICMSLKDTSQTTVRSRGVGFVRGPCFTRDGSFYFSWFGDLWTGEIKMKDGSAWLVADRVAPLAWLRTDIERNYGSGIFEIALAGPKLYYHLKERGGTRFGSIESIMNPTELRETKAPQPHYHRVTDLLSSSIIVEFDAAATPFLCASPDGTKVFFVADNQCYLVENNGKPVRLPAKFDRMRQ